MDNGENAAPVAVVNEAVAKVLWPGEEAIGQRLWGFGDRTTWWTVIGVVADTRYRDWLEVRPTVYYPMRRVAVAPPKTLLVRLHPAAGSTAIRPIVEAAFANTGVSVDVLGTPTLRDVLAAPAARPILASTALLGFAMTTLLIAAAGIYGVFGASVQERRRDLGVRLALGATTSQIVGVILGKVALVSALGALGGLFAGWWATTLLGSVVWGVPLLDLPTYGVVLATTFALALLAGTPAALRAASVDPAVAFDSD